MILLDGVSFRYRSAPRPALSDVCLHVPPGQLVGVLGRSGSGRSTLAATLNGTIPHLVRGELTGRITVADEDVTAKRPRDLAGRVGILFQDFEAQLFSTNVALEVAFGPENLGVSRPEIARRVEKYLALVGLSDMRQRSPASLSGGQKQRLALASVLALEPAVLVLDEPTSDLDPGGRRDLFAAVQQLRADRNVTVVLIDTETDEMAWTDNILVLDGGRIHVQGRPADFWADSNRLRSAGVQGFTVGRVLQQLGVSRDIVDAASAARAILHAGWQIDPIAKEQLRESERGQGLGEVLLEVRDLVHRYPDGTMALGGIDIAIRRGEFIAILGQNGSGKTTLMKHLNGILAPTAGEVRIGGQAVTADAPGGLLRRVGLVFQNPDHQIFAERIWDEVAFGPRLQGLTQSEVAARVGQSLEAVGLAGMGDLDPFVLTKGGRQRVAVAATLAAKPEVIILDEPTTGLDHEERRGMMELVTRLNASGHTIVIVTHAMDIAAAYARRTIVMHGGRVAADGLTRDIFADASLLDRLGLAPPPIVQLANALGVPALCFEELIGALVRHR